MIGRVPAFQHRGLGSVPGVSNYNFHPGIGCMSFICVLSCVVPDGDPDFVLTTDYRDVRHYVSVNCSGPKSVLSLQESDVRALGL